VNDVHHHLRLGDLGELWRGETSTRDESGEASSTAVILACRRRGEWVERDGDRSEQTTSAGGQGTTGTSTVRSLRALTDLKSRSVGPTSHPDHTTESTTSP